jgi:hypothetical protein
VEAEEEVVVEAAEVVEVVEVQQMQQMVITPPRILLRILLLQLVKPPTCFASTSIA